MTVTPCPSQTKLSCAVYEAPVRLCPSFLHFVSLAFRTRPKLLQSLLVYMALAEGP